MTRPHHRAPAPRFATKRLFLAMNRTAGAALLIVVLAACYGAQLVHRSLGGGQQGSGAAPTPPPAIAAGEPVDQRDPLPLTAVRAPADTGDRALEHARTIVGFGPRHSGKVPTPGWSQQLEFITAELARHGIAVERDTWTDRKELLTFTNLVATIPGQRPERIVLACHHDTKCTQGHLEPAHNFHFVGANDGASAVALLLALAPTLQQCANKATLQLVFFDGEESLDWSWNGGVRALFGSRRFVRQHRDDAAILGKAPRIEAMILLDMVGRTDLHIQEELFSTATLRRITFAAAVATGSREQFYRRAEAANDDHTPFLEVGIPAVDLIDLAGNPHWHQPTDTLANLSAASLQRVADVVLTMLPEVERTYLGERH